MRPRVSSRVRYAAAVVVALGAIAGMVAIVLAVRSDESGVGRLAFAATRPAVAPFDEFSEARVAVGDRCLRVLVALNPSQRVQGLRGVKALTPYDGMLFVERSDARGAFTMAGTPLPLDITFFAATGAPVDRFRMTPCPLGTDDACPAYESKAPYRYALEQPAGPGAASGSLGGCTA